MSDERIEVPIPDRVGFVTKPGEPVSIVIPRDAYASFVEAVSKAGLYGDPVHWSVYSKVLQERNAAKEQAELWKTLAERQDNTAPLRMRLQAAERERDEWRRRSEGFQEELSRYVYTTTQETDELRRHLGSDGDVEELKATIVRQAREITRLTEESE